MRILVIFTYLTLSGTVLGTFTKWMIEAMRPILPTALLQSGLATTWVTVMINPLYGKRISIMRAVPDLPSRVEMEPKWVKQFPQSKSVKIRYGPYAMPSMNRINGIFEMGSLWNYPDVWVEKPCQKCVIIGIKAGMEYMDGTNANIDSQAWLHHMVLFNAGWDRADQTCWNAWSSLPHGDVACNPLWCERMFASGNDRTPFWLAEHYDNSSGTKPAGYFVRPHDRFALIIDLMNDSPAEKSVYLTMYYDYIDGWPAGFDHIRPVWLDVDQCGISEVRPLKQTGKYTIEASPWYATLDGEIIGYGGHLHDGGVVVNLTVDGVQDCPSWAIYGATPEFISPKMSDMKPMQMDTAMVHISNQTTCWGTALKTRFMKKGQKWTLTADYDYDKFKGSLEPNGEQDSVMGIAIMYIRQSWNATDVDKRVEEDTVTKPHPTIEMNSTSIAAGQGKNFTNSTQIPVKNSTKTSQAQAQSSIKRHDGQVDSKQPENNKCFGLLSCILGFHL